jgi:endonuclease IV
MNLRLGFSTQIFSNCCSTKEAVKNIENVGCRTIEIIFEKNKGVDNFDLDEIEAEDLKKFDWVSLHAPTINYGKNRETETIFGQIHRFNNKRTLDLVVFHPDCISDFKVFDKIDFNVGFENMDCHKYSYKQPYELEKLVNLNNRWKIVLDVNHVYTNDKSMELGSSFHRILSERIAEYHLSGFSTIHDPLYKTKQIKIIKAIKNFRLPVIVESLLTPETIKKEKDYIIKMMKKVN